jgi:hypothetical protein
MRSTPLIDARSASVPRFNGRFLASISFKITFTTASPSEPAAAGARRRTDSAADPRACPQSRLVLLRRISATNDGVGRLTAGGGSPSWSHVVGVCTSAWVFHRSRSIGEVQLISSLESLHEDLYFVTLDFFDAIGRTTTRRRLAGPGKIFPIIHPERRGQKGPGALCRQRLGTQLEIRYAERSGQKPETSVATSRASMRARRRRSSRSCAPTR